MRLGIHRHANRRHLALQAEGHVIDVPAVAAKDKTLIAKQVSLAQGVEDVLRLGPSALKWLHQVAQDAEHHAAKRRRVRNPRWVAPLLAPQKICCIGQNYADHAREQGVEPPTKPILFAKFPTAIVGPGDAIRWDPKLSDKIDWEAELAVVIGKKARNVPKAKALHHVAGYMPANDVTARDLQKGDGQWVRGKSLDTFCPLGPHLVTADEVDDPQDLRIACRVNGVTKQDSSTKNLIFNVADLVAFLSQAFTLLPGDVILTGTPPGVGVFRNPPEFLKDRDTVEVEIEKLGVLANVCRTVS